MSEDLSPAQLSRLLAALELAKMLVLDVIRGRSIRQEDVEDIRQSMRGVRRVLDALDDEHPWDDPEET